MEKQGFLRNIKMDHVILEDYAKEIKACGSNVILYGAGCWARQQYRMLQELGVEINAVGIDASYYKPGMKFFDKEIQPIEELVKIIPNPVLWVGFNLDKKSYGALRKDLAARFGIEKIYACDCAKYENFARQNYKYGDVVAHTEEFQWLYDRLDDVKSKETFLSYLNQRISGDYGWVENLYDPNHYFAEDVIKLENEIFIDCGAFTGDTIQGLLAKSKPQKVFAFEPDEKNYQTLVKNFADNDNIVCLKLGAFSKKTTLSFAGGNADASKIVDDGTIQIEVDSIDNVLNGEKATFIKMDIEGAELEALKGAQNTIRNYHPKLAISAYHKFEDLFTLPQYIYSLDNSYKFYLCRHSHLTHELVLYAL